MLDLTATHGRLGLEHLSGAASAYGLLARVYVLAKMLLLLQLQAGMAVLSGET